jgi:hypothetical protein
MQLDGTRNKILSVSVHVTRFLSNHVPVNLWRLELSFFIWILLFYLIYTITLILFVYTELSAQTQSWFLIFYCKNKLHPFSFLLF